MVFNNDDIPEADCFTPDTIEDTYVNMEIVLPRDGEVPEFSKVTKCMWDLNGIPIVRDNYNPMLDTRVYDIEYLDGYNLSLYVNNISENIFSQVDE